MTNRIDWFNSEHAADAIELGIITVPTFQKYIRYRIYMKYKTDLISMNAAIELACVEANCSRSPMLKAVKWFQNKNQQQKSKPIKFE